MRGDTYTQTSVERAARICSALACQPELKADDVHATTNAAYHLGYPTRRFPGVPSKVNGLALKAWWEVDRRFKALAVSRDLAEDHWSLCPWPEVQWAEAEALLMDGWLPEEE